MGNFTQNINFSFLLAGVVVSLIALSLGMNYIFFQEKAENSDLQVQIYETGTGYGYKILSEGNVLIKQDYIPASENNQPFCDREQADRVATFVLQKIQYGLNPAISFSELKELEIEFDCAKKR